MANGDSMILGKNNDAAGPTVLTKTPVQGPGPGGVAFTVVGFDRTAVHGSSETETAVIGISYAPTSTDFWGDPMAGVVGEGATGVSGRGTGKHEANGVLGTGFRCTGVRGDSAWGFGVVGTSHEETGVYGHSDKWTGVVGSTSNPESNYAGYFWGPVGIEGPLRIFGKKSAAVPFPDGSYRLMYSMESPENWFEDFGRARLIRGRARVRIDPSFASVVRLANYHVFLVAEGDSRGLYVSKRGKGEFEVREQQGGTSNVRFSYRVVAQRKDVTSKRFERVKRPARPPRPKPNDQLVRSRGNRRKRPT